MRTPAITITALIVFWSSLTYSQPAVQPDLAGLTQAVEKARQDMKIPGFALAVVKDGNVVLAKGFGQRDVEANLPVTPDTLFAIGSCTKAFTAMSAAIAQDEGRLSLDDSPKKYLPSFRLQDPEADEKITIRDMLCHRSGLTGTDLAWITGVLNRDEVIQVAGLAKPTAKFRERWQYQNVMYSAAGQAVAAAYGTTWEQVITDKILRPLGMNNSDLSVARMQKSNDFARGYSYDPDTKQSRLVPTRDLTNIAPAGAINSSATDMAKWVRLMLNGGEIDGTRIVSADRFKELITKQIDMSPTVGYALGWGVGKLHDTEILEHAGGIDGFNAFVAIFPEKKLGYVLLTNVSESPINGSVREIIWSHLIEPGKSPATAPAQVASAQIQVDPKQEVGKYGILEVVFRDGALFAVVAGQPDYKLENVGGRRYKLSNAPPGFFVTFRENEDPAVGTEVYLEQPHGNYTFAREPSAEEMANTLAQYGGPHKNLLGTYSTEGFSLDVTVRRGKLAAIVRGQPTYTLVEKQEDVFSLPPLPESFEMTIRRDEEGAVTGAFLKQPRPQPDMELKRTATPGAPIDVNPLIQRAIDAAGGGANLRKHQTLKITYDLEMESQGVRGRGTILARAPDASTKTTEFIALGKPIGSMTELFDGTAGKTEGSFIPTTPYRKSEIADAKAVADFLGPAAWKSQFKSFTSKGKAKVGDEGCDVLQMKPETGPTVTVYISDTSGLVLRRDFVKSGEHGAGKVSEFFSDFRAVDGVKVPFRTDQTSAEGGKVVQTVKEVEFVSD